MPGLRAVLQAIDARLDMLDVPRTSTLVGAEGRVFQDWAGAEPFFGGRTASDFALPSSEYQVIITFAVGGSGVPTGADLDVYDAAQRMARDVLPAWVELAVVTSTGFILDQSPLDLTGFAP